MAATVMFSVVPVPEVEFSISHETLELAVQPHEPPLRLRVRVPAVGATAGDAGDTVTAQPLTFVTSVAAPPAEPPPETVTALVTVDGALDATLTVTVIAG